VGVVGLVADDQVKLVEPLALGFGEDTPRLVDREEGREPVRERRTFNCTK
jgi:hypothetical protein